MIYVGLRELRTNIDKYIKLVDNGEKIFVHKKSKTVFIIAPPEFDHDWTIVPKSNPAFDHFVNEIMIRISQNNLKLATIKQNEIHKNIFRIRRGGKQLTIKILKLEMTFLPTPSPAAAE